MAFNIDGASKRITLDKASTTASEIWSRWSDWFILNDNSKWPLAFRQVGGDDLGGGLSIPPYFFLLNDWRIRPMESSHTLIITGNLFVDGGGVPVVNTLGSYNVAIQYTVPVQAQGISTSGSTGPTADEIASAVWDKLVLDHQDSGSMGKALSTASTGGVDADILATAIWDKSLNSITATNSIGEFIQKKVLTVAKFIGLK